MIFSSGAISGYDSKGRYDGSQRTKVDGVSRVAAIKAVSETRRMTDERFRKTSQCTPKEDFKELFEQDHNMLEQAGDYLSTAEDIKLSVLKQVLKRMQQIKEPWKKTQDSSTVLRTQWIKTAVDSAFFEDTCCIAYQTNGFALLSSGKNVLFDICVEMSEDFCDKYENYTYQNNMITEPVVVRINDRITDIPDIRCLFDLDKLTGGNIYSKLKVLMKDVNGYNIRVDLQDGNAGTLYQRNMLDSQRFIHKNICFGKTSAVDAAYEMTDENVNPQKNNVNYMI